MIKICECEEIQKETIEYDLYTPINIELGIWNISDEPTIYWRTGDFSRSLIEVGIGKDKKDIRSITLVLCDNIYKENYNIEQKYYSISGCPVVAITEFADKIYFDEQGELDIYIGQEKVCILFSKQEISSSIVNGNVTFY